MWYLLFLTLFIGVSANEYGCPTNVTCVEKETCCQTNTGLWACCPMEDGICCDDGLHCCSKGQTCSPDGKCSSTSNQDFSALILQFEQNQIQTIPCADGSSCPDGNTCCQLASGQYGCCPIPDAVCCSDHLHCCPTGHTCDVEHSRCKKKFDQLNDVPCPGGSSACPDGQTCCLLQSGDYGCCPLVDAVCCSDHLHCCPHGSRCDLEHGACVQQISIPWFTKKAAYRYRQQLINLIDDKETSIYQLIESSNSHAQIICPDATSLCPSTSTCCITPDITWGCCPIEDAVCCSDHIHCCPTHYKCDLHVFKCDHPVFGSIPMLKKEKALKRISSTLILSKVDLSLSTIQCPDEKSYCPEETTCCEIENGSYGCCPYAQASCCSDKVHCCGNGYSCDNSGTRCIRHLNSLNETDIISSSFKLKSLRNVNNVEPLIPLSLLEGQSCPDGKMTCSPSETCCPNTENGQLTYSCCPYSKGVCCGSNGTVCCPNNYVCDDKQLSCELSDSTLFRSAPLEPGFSQCGSSEVGCSYDQTCCRTYGSADGDYACCAFADAECCGDGQHCCPRGTRCNLQSGGCSPTF